MRVALGTFEGAVMIALGLINGAMLMRVIQHTDCLEATPKRA